MEKLSKTKSFERLYEPISGDNEFLFEKADYASFPESVQRAVRLRRRTETNFLGQRFTDDWKTTLKVQTDRIVSYVACHSLPENGIELSYISDTVDETIAGEGMLIFGPYPHIDAANNPVVGYTANTRGKEWEGRGLGERRVALMGALSRQLYGLPLRSSNEINERGRMVWIGLEKSGRAKRLDINDEHGLPRYEFIK